MSGAGAGGVPEGGWNWQFLPALYGGLLVGFIATIAILVFVFRRAMPLHLRVLWVLFIPASFVFAVSTVIHFVLIQFGYFQ